MYPILILAQTLVLPVVSGSIHLAVAGGNALVVFGIWWAFWGVGVRLALAGVSQLTNPARTTKGILGINDPGAEQVVHELGFANLCMGIVALAVPFAPALTMAGAVPGAIYLGLAGARHLAKRGKSRNELVATWTDILVFVAVLVGVAGMLWG